jgi:hypothetical protein
LDKNVLQEDQEGLIYYLADNKEALQTL